MQKPVTASYQRRAAFLAAVTVVAALAASSCGREPTAGGPTGRATLQLGPLFQAGGTSAIRDSVTQLRSRVSRLLPAPAAVIADVVERFVETGSAPDSLTVTFPLQGRDAEYEVEIKAIGAAGDTLYRLGPLRFTAGQISERGVVHLQVDESSILYIGPGSEATKVVASPRVVNLTPGQSSQLSATAFSAAGAALPRALFDWVNITKNGVALVSGEGVVFAQNTRGTELIGVLIRSVLQPIDTVRVNVSLGAAQVLLVSGGNQSASVGTPLANPIVVRVTAVDGVPVPGATVQFSTTGGSLTAATAASASDGTAQTRWTLGSVVGQQTLTVSIAGVSGVQLAVQATATQTAASVLSILSILPTAITTTQTATIVVQALTASGQPASGVPVGFSSSGTGNTFSPATVVTGTSGQATSTFSSSVAETKTITVLSGSVSATATLPVVVPNTAAARLVKVSGDNQTVRYGTNWPAPLTVQALDVTGKPVAGALIDWGTATGAARKVTDANGLSSNLYFLPNDPVTYPTGVQLQVSATLVGTSVVVTFFYVAVP